MVRKLFQIISLLAFTIGFSQVQNITPTVTPNPFERNQNITITIPGSQINEATWGVTGNALYIWAWMLDANNNPIGDCPNNGTWTSSSESNRLTYNSVNDTYTISFIPEIFYNNTTFGKMGFLIKAKDGSGDKKTNDNVFGVGAFQYTLNTPLPNSTTLLASGSNFNITAVNTNGNATYNLYVNGNSTPVNTQNVSNYSYTDSNVTINKNYELRISQGTTTYITRFSVIIAPLTGTIPIQAIPNGMVDGLNYDPNDPTKVTLVLNAPFKNFIYVAGNFNNWNPNSTYLMKRESSLSSKFWIEITGLTSGQDYAYQYWVCQNVNLPTNSPNVVKTADPFSTLVLSPYDDPEIISLGVFPNLPVYNTIAPGQDREVSLFKTGPSNYFTYNWSSATTNFVKPNYKDLVFYEVLIRDFDTNRTYQDLINKINYFKNLNITAIKLMPVMEFEGNMSWGYNTSYHMALDKRYGPPTKLKEFVDLCHQNGIAVVLDIALNHVFGRSPLERMWMLDTDNDGWSNGYPRVSNQNPYVNSFDAHSYNVGSDLNHFRESGPGRNLTNTYVIRTLQHWIQEYKIDGYRWDLTKGFTNQCPPDVAGGQEACTNQYRSDRVAKMKWYADKQWEADNTSYVVFEHLGFGGSRTEELEWANHRSGEGKGVMFWHKMTDNYANLIKGNANGIDGVTIPGDNNRAIGYAESHDEERVIYKAITEAGQTQGNLNKALKRLSAQGAVHLLVPGPKMIWHFGALGWDDSLFLCSNGNVQFNDGCKLDTKPQPQWTENWMANAARSTVYNNWAKMIDIKKRNAVFENGIFAWNTSNSSRPRLDIWTSTSPQANLSYVIVLTNFTDFDADLGGFPYTGTWVNLMDNSTFSVSNTNHTVNIEAGGFRVFGNQQAILSNNSFNTVDFTIYPNPTKNSFAISIDVAQVEVYNVTGQLVKTYNSVINNEPLDITALETGMYIVKIKDNNGTSITKKLVKE
jgi:1,4-alpha-glucan branching enzyme